MGETLGSLTRQADRSIVSVLAISSPLTSAAAKPARSARLFSRSGSVWKESYSLQSFQRLTTLGGLGVRYPVIGLEQVYQRVTASMV